LRSLKLLNRNTPSGGSGSTRVVPLENVPGGNVAGLSESNG
jgi:hypothetical protein